MSESKNLEDRDEITEDGLVEISKRHERQEPGKSVKDKRLAARTKKIKTCRDRLVETLETLNEIKQELDKLATEDW